MADLNETTDEVSVMLSAAKQFKLILDKLKKCLQKSNLLSYSGDVMPSEE